MALVAGSVNVSPGSPPTRTGSGLALLLYDDEAPQVLASSELSDNEKYLLLTGLAGRANRLAATLVAEINPELGGGGLAFSPVDYLWNASGGSFTPVGGNYTVGAPLIPMAPVTIAGVRFITGAAGAHTIRAKLYRSTTLLASVDVACPGPGVYTGTFASPFAITTTYVGQLHYIGMWETSGSYYTQRPSNLHFPGTYLGSTSVPCQLSPELILVNPCRAYNAGDVAPVNLGSSNHYPVEPVLG